MSDFQINLFSRKQEYHKFSTEDFALLEIGIGNYTRSSLCNFFGVADDGSTPKGKLNPDIAEFFGMTDQSDARNIIDKLTAKEQDIADSIEMLAYDEDLKIYRLKTGFEDITKINSNKFKSDKYKSPIDETNLKDFLQKWNDIQIGSVTDQLVINSYNLLAHRIQNSASGCITFRSDIDILRRPRNIPIKLFVLNSRDSDSSRTISFNGSPFISAIPQTSYGMKYGFENTLNAGTGGYDKPSNNNPKDKVAGQLRLAYDPATGTWESGTQQIMVRLIDNIDAAVIPQRTGEELLNVTKEECYESSPEDNPIMGKPGSGRAIPLSTENGNPNLFGPDFKGGCQGNTQKSIIMAVNRSEKTYKEGTLVICSYINGEWLIVGGEGQTVDQKTFGFGFFEFQQYLIPQNTYFAVPNKTEKFLPNRWSRKIRDSYYFESARDNLLDPDDYKLNLAATLLDYNEDTENQLSDLLDQFDFINSDDGVQIINAAQDNSKTGDIQTMTYIFQTYSAEVLSSVGIGNYTEEKKIIYIPPKDEVIFGMPKNILSKTARTLALSMPAVQLTATDPIDKYEVPLFWGMLFPDGYSKAQCKTFIDKGETLLKFRTIYKNDPNLKELSAFNTRSIPSFKDNTKTWLWAYSNGDIDIDKGESYLAGKNPFDLVRKTGGIYQNGFKFFISVHTLNAFLSKDPEINMDGLYRSNYQIEEDSSIYGLEPITPKRLQFSPMSLDFMYSVSSLGADGFENIKTNIDFLSEAKVGKIMDIDTENDFTLKDYARHLWGQNDNGDIFENALVIDNIFINNKYNKDSLRFDFAFGPDAINLSTVTRHPAPLGVPLGNLIIPEPPKTVNGFVRRGPAIAVLTCKSHIKTSASRLSFTVKQSFGLPQKTTVGGGQGGGITILPIGGGLAWQNPSSPISVNKSKQWGDRNRTDDIDSLGTDALHIRIFEHWPEDQTIYLGYIYTPLHFNASGPQYEYNFKFDNDSKKIIAEKIPLETEDDSIEFVKYISPVDFKEPTKKQNEVFNVGEQVTSGNLASFAEWKYNTKRRGKLLTDGGFAYFKKAIFISNVLLRENNGPVNRGSNYKKDDTFSYSDGSIAKVTKVGSNGEINEIEFISNFDDRNIVKNPEDYQDITSVTSINPIYNGLAGQGAIFDYKFTIGKTLDWDKPPKEVVNTTRITSSSNNGEDYIDSDNRVTVEISDNTKKEYDIFYFFHNDPIVYNLGGGTAPYDNTFAHYVISEVDPA